MRLLKSIMAATASALLLTACATSSDKEELGTQIVMDLDGNFVVLNEDGTPSTNPDSLLIAQMLSGAMAKTSGALENDEILQSDADGNYTHIQSGGICPKTWGTFTRARTPTIFNANGMDVGCSFESEELQSVFTFYFYKNSETIEAEKAQLVSMIKTRVPTAKPVDDVFVMKRGGDEALYDYAIMESQNSNGIKVRDGVFLTDDSGWRLKLRVTYPSSRAVEMESLAALMLQGQMDQVNQYGLIPADRPQPGDEDKIES